MEPFTATLLIGVGLLACGYALGRTAGFSKGCSATINELFANNLADRNEVLTFYANQGHELAQNALEALNRQRKRDFMIKSRSTEKDNAQD